MSAEPDPKRLAMLEARLNEARGSDEEQAPPGADMNQANMAWQMVIELISGIGIGFGIGYGLDVLFGTKPILMVLFILLGFAAGVKVMIGTAKHMQKKMAPHAGQDEGDEGLG